jgi:hypothetical protein
MGLELAVLVAVVIQLVVYFFLDDRSVGKKDL